MEKVCRKCNNSMKEVLEKIYKHSNKEFEYKFGTCGGCEVVFCDCCLYSAFMEDGEMIRFDPLCAECLSKRRK